MRDAQTLLYTLQIRAVVTGGGAFPVMCIVVSSAFRCLLDSDIVAHLYTQPHTILHSGLGDARDAFRLSLNRFLCSPRDFALEPSWRQYSIVMTCPDQRSWLRITMASMLLPLASSRMLLLVCWFFQLTPTMRWRYHWCTFQGHKALYTSILVHPWNVCGHI